MNTAEMLQRATARVPEPARQHVRLVSRLLVAQAGVAAALSLSFSRRNVPVIVTTVAFVAVLAVLAVLAGTGTPSARTAVLGFELAVFVLGLYRFAFERYLGGTIFALVIIVALLHPAVVRAYGVVPPDGYGAGRPRGTEPSGLMCGDRPGGPAGTGGPPITDAGGALGESAGR